MFFCVNVFFLTTLQWVCVWLLLFVIMFSVWLCLLLWFCFFMFIVGGLVFPLCVFSCCYSEAVVVFLLNDTV